MKHSQPVVADVGHQETPRSHRAARELALRIVRGIYPARNFQDGFTVLTEEGQLHRCKVVYADPAPNLRGEAHRRRQPQNYFWVEVSEEERLRLATYFQLLAQQLSRGPQAPEAANEALAGEGRHAA